METNKTRKLFFMSENEWTNYGIRDWVESLPVKSISMATLANSYRIVGL